MKKLILIVGVILVVVIALKVLLPKTFKASFTKTLSLASQGKAKITSGKGKLIEKLKAFDEALAKKIA